MHHFVTEMCTRLLQKGALWDMWCIVGFVRQVYYFIAWCGIANQLINSKVAKFLK